MWISDHVRYHFMLILYHECLPSLAGQQTVNHVENSADAGIYVVSSYKKAR